MSKSSPVIHEAITLNPDPTEFMPVEVASAFPASAKSVLSPEEKARVDAFIEAVPDENDTGAINYWVDLDDKIVYLEGWCDKCLASTGFPSIGDGDWDAKIEYMVRDTKRTLREKQEESNRPLIGPGHWPLIEGGFREFEAGDRGWLYGVTWGVYTKPETLVVSEPIAFEKRLEYELKRAGFIAEPKRGNPVSMYSSVANLPEFRGMAWRAESGYGHPPETTVADIIRFEREELGNEYPDISDELLRDLDRYSASDAVWVNRRRKDCLTYLSEGESEEAVGRVPLPEGSKIITLDYCGGYLVLRGSAKSMLKKGGNPMARPRTEEERKSFHERVFGKGSTPPLERLGRGQAVNNMLPMPPESGPPLPRVIGLRWPWKK